MKLTIISEDFRDGLSVEWPTVPRVGEAVTFKFPGGTPVLVVDAVKYCCDSNGVLTDVEVRLTY